MSDVLTDFKKSIDNFPKNGGDLNIICSITYGEYMAYVTILDALLLPQQMIRRELEGLLSTIDNATYNTVIKNLNQLNTALKSVLPQPFNKNMTMDFNVGKFGDMLTNVCADFLGSLPESLFNIFQDIQHGITDLANLTNAVLALPSDLVGSITGSLLKLKDDALKAALGGLFDTVLAPVLAYDSFLKSNGIFELIDKMKKIERCMTKPGICNRPRKDFIHKASKKIYSTYYTESFMVDSKGNINLRSFGGTSTQQSQVHNIIKNMNSFRLTVR